MTGEGSDKMLRYSWCTIREVSMVCVYMCVRARSSCAGRSHGMEVEGLACLLT